MPQSRPRLLLAADHRWRGKNSATSGRCRASGSATSSARRRRLSAGARASAAARDFGALLIDEQYASAVVARSIEAGLNVGTPAEKAGAIPLAWATDPFSAALTGAFVKVLARYRTDDEAAILA
jgi:myo-inositol catabolism protein IolC